MVLSVSDDAVAFFREHAGYGVARGETQEQGRERTAREMAEAEAWLVAQPGFTVEWRRDEEYDPADYDIPMPEMGWGCVVKARGKVASLWSVTFDGDGYPHGNPYARVVVAELAEELRDELED